MVVNDLDVVGVALPEREANAPTRVYGHRPLAGPVSFELVKPDALERAQVLQSRGNVQRQQQVCRRREIQAAKSIWRFAAPYPAASGVAP